MIKCTATNQWFVPQVKGDIPPGCAAYGFVCDGTRLLVFGGMVEYGKYSSELYELQASRWEWKRLKPRPPKNGPFPCARLGHSFTLIGNRVFLFGGLANDSDDPKNNIPRYLNDLYVLEMKPYSSVMQWDLPVTYGTPPPPRESHTAVAYTPPDGQHPKLIIYGGMSGCRLGDLWQLDIESMTWSKPMVYGPPPLPRSLHSATLINNKMYVFGGWVPLVVDTDNRGGTPGSLHEKEWKCTNTLATLNLDSMQWEIVTNESFDESTPRARAGHCSVGISSRLYIWSGRDGYRKAWNNQVCCKDLWYLETDRPQAPGRVQLVRAATTTLEVSWGGVPTADAYILQIQKYDIPPTQASNPTAHPPGIPLAPSVAVPETKGVTPAKQTSVSPKVSKVAQQKPPAAQGSYSGMAALAAAAAATSKMATPSAPNIIQVSAPTAAKNVRLVTAQQASGIQSKSPQTIRVMTPGQNVSTPQIIVQNVQGQKTAAAGTPIVVSGAAQQTVSIPQAGGGTQLMTLVRTPTGFQLQPAVSGTGSPVGKQQTVVRVVSQASSINTSGQRTVTVSSAGLQPQILQVISTTGAGTPGKSTLTKSSLPSVVTSSGQITVSRVAGSPVTQQIQGQQLQQQQKIILQTQGAPGKVTMAQGVSMSPGASGTSQQAKLVTGPGGVKMLVLQSPQQNQQQPQQILLNQGTSQQPITVQIPAHALTGAGGSKTITLPAGALRTTGAGSIMTSTGQVATGQKIFQLPPGTQLPSNMRFLTASGTNLIPQAGVAGQKVVILQGSPQIQRPVTATATVSVAPAVQVSAAQNAPAPGPSGDTKIPQVDGGFDEEPNPEGSVDPKVELQNVDTEANDEAVADGPVEPETNDQTEAGDGDQEEVKSQEETTEKMDSEDSTKESTPVESEVSTPLINSETTPETLVKQEATDGQTLSEADAGTPTPAVPVVNQVSAPPAPATPSLGVASLKMSVEFPVGLAPPEQMCADDPEPAPMGGSSSQSPLTLFSSSSSLLDSDPLATLASAAISSHERQQLQALSEAAAAQMNGAQNGVKLEAQSIKSEDGIKSEGGFKKNQWFDVGVIKNNSCVVHHFYTPPDGSGYRDVEHSDIDMSNLPIFENLIKMELEPGTAYKLRVAGINGCGRGPWSEVSAFKTCLPGYPGAPSAIKITKSSEGAHLSWEPPQLTAGEIVEYSVYLAVKSSAPPTPGSSNPLAFSRVYCSKNPSCTVNSKDLTQAHVDTTTKPAIIFRIAAKNEKGKCLLLC